MGIELRTGTFPGTLDEKGRVSIPARLREWYSGELIITRGGYRPCAQLMTPQVWERYSKKLMNFGAVDEDEYELIQHLYIHSAQVVELDKSGRVPIPADTRKWAGLTRECLVISAENHLEIWDYEGYYAYLNENRARAQEAIKKMGAVRLFKTDENGPE
ncbi:MAG: division/cell wall cluster transcriptional repressor MraZ [Treponema sp.]|nr:division/cell wall cluster transcriptional repressor MraZ [Treponema sp.]